MSKIKILSSLSGNGIKSSHQGHSSQNQTRHQSTRHDRIQQSLHRRRQCSRGRKFRRRQRRGDGHGDYRRQQFDIGIPAKQINAGGLRLRLTERRAATNALLLAEVEALLRETCVQDRV